MKRVTYLRVLRLAKGLTLADLADTVGVYPEHLRLVEVGETNAGKGLAQRLARVLGVPMEVLFE